MISKQEIMVHARELKLSPDIIEKDYILNWVLAGIAHSAELKDTWLFKGGTCLKKCFFENYRFSEDLDFTLYSADSAHYEPLSNEFYKISEWVYQRSGIELPLSHIRFEIYQNPRGRESIRGRLSYRGPLQRRGDIPGVKLDITSDEQVVLTPDNRRIYHPYSDTLGGDVVVQSYCLEEIYSEKLRALVERLRPRDLYDVVHLYDDQRWQPNRSLLLDSLRKKCVYRNIRLPTIELLDTMPERDELISEWENMLVHQVADLLPFKYYWQRLPEVLNWIYTGE